MAQAAGRPQAGAILTSRGWRHNCQKLQGAKTESHARGLEGGLGVALGGGPGTPAERAPSTRLGAELTGSIAGKQLSKLTGLIGGPRRERPKKMAVVIY